MKIDDGEGNKVQAGVNGRKELKTFAISETEIQAATSLGLGFNLNSGEVTSISSGSATLIYFKNGEASTYAINAIALGMRGFTNLTDMAVVTVLKNPTTGDLITDETPIDIKSNSNFGSSNNINGSTLLFKGKNAGTISGEEEIHAILYAGNNQRLFASLNMEIPKGSSIAIKIDTGGATAGNAYCALIGHLKDVKRTG